MFRVFLVHYTLYFHSHGDVNFKTINSDFPAVTQGLGFCDI